MSNEAEKIDNQQGNGVLPCAIPRFCFCCGGELKEVGLGFLECEKCDKSYLPYLNYDNEQCLALCHS